MIHPLYIYSKSLPLPRDPPCTDPTFCKFCNALSRCRDRRHADSAAGAKATASVGPKAAERQCIAEDACIWSIVRKRKSRNPLYALLMFPVPGPTEASVWVHADTSPPSQAIDVLSLSDEQRTLYVTAVLGIVSRSTRNGSGQQITARP